MSSGVGQGLYLVSLNSEPRHLTTVLCWLLYFFFLSLKFYFIMWTPFFPHVYEVQIYKLSLWKVTAICWIIVPKSAAPLAAIMGSWVASAFYFKKGSKQWLILENWFRKFKAFSFLWKSNDAKGKKIGTSGRKPAPLKEWGKNLCADARSIWGIVMSNNCS